MLVETASALSAGKVPPRRVMMRRATMAARRRAPAEVRGALSYCGRPTARSRVLAVRSPETGRLNAFISHTASCKLAWACPSCGAAHAYRKQQEVERTILGWQALASEESPAADHRAALVTLTVAHDRTRSLAESLPVVLRAFTILMNSHLVRACRANGVLFGWARAIEITWNPQTGWHPHIHALLFTPDLPALKRAWSTRTDEHGVGRGLKMEWLRALRNASIEAALSRPIAAMPSKQDFREAQLADAGYLAGYVTKDGVRWSVAAELTRQDVKSGRQRSLAPLELLLAADGDRRRRPLWREYVRATKGVQRVSFSKSFYLSDDGTHKRMSVAQHLGRAWQRQQNRESWIQAGYGDDPRAVANREASEAQEAALRALSAAERRAADARERELDADDDPPLVELASFQQSEQLSGRAGRLTLGRMHSEGFLFGLLNAVEQDDGVQSPQQTAKDYIDKHGLPVDPHRPRRRLARSADDPWVVYRAKKADFEARLDAKGLDEETHERLVDRFEAIYRPQARRPWPREK